MMTHSGQMLLSDTESTAHSEEEQECIQTLYIQVSWYLGGTSQFHCISIYSVKHCHITFLCKGSRWLRPFIFPSYPDRERTEVMRLGLKQSNYVTALTLIKQKTERFNPTVLINNLYNIKVVKEHVNTYDRVGMCRITYFQNQSVSD